MSNRTKQIMEAALAIQNQREDEENNQGIANSSNVIGNSNFLDEALSPEDVAEIIRDAEIILEDGFCISQQQPELTSDTVKIRDLVLNETKEELQIHEIIQEEIQLATYNFYIEPEKTAKEHTLENTEKIIVEDAYVPQQHSQVISDTVQDMDPLHGGETESSSSDTEIPLGKRIKREGRKREVNKKLRMSGNKYVGFRKPKGQKNTFHDTSRDERLLKPRCNCKDTSKQCKQFTDDNRKDIFSRFWSQMSWEQRKVFVATTVKICDRKRPEIENSRRSITLKYHLILNNTHVPVCKLMYLNTLSLEEWSARSWALSASNGIVRSNQVEVSTRLKRADIFKEDREFLEAFLINLHKLPSHYCRKDTDQLYLEQTFQSWNDLFKVYQKQCIDENRKVLSSKLLRQVAKKMKIAIFSPRKDQCDVCFMFKNGNVAEEDYKKHIEAKNAARAEKEKDKEQAMKGKCHVVTMDVQAVKLSPQIPASTLYYKTKLCCHNFTLYNLATKEVVCYWYNESQADGQASTYASFLLDFLKEKFLSSGDKKPIIIYSDGCTAQNRNAILANALLYISKKHDVKITQKFLEKGHTQMECDSVHSTIERRLKNKEIYLPSDYLRITTEARRPTPYIAKTKDFDFFRDFSRKDLMKYRSIKPSKTSVVTEIRALEYYGGAIKYKLNFNTELFDELQNRPNKIKDFELTEFPPLYNQRNKITKTKYDHLQTIKKCIPQDCWTFYDNLPFGAK